MTIKKTSSRIVQKVDFPLFKIETCDLEVVRNVGIVRAKAEDLLRASVSAHVKLEDLAKDNVQGRHLVPMTTGVAEVRLSLKVAANSLRTDGRQTFHGERAFDPGQHHLRKQKEMEY